MRLEDITCESPACTHTHSIVVHPRVFGNLKLYRCKYEHTCSCAHACLPCTRPCSCAHERTPTHTSHYCDPISTHTCEGTSNVHSRTFRTYYIVYTCTWNAVSLIPRPSIPDFVPHLWIKIRKEGQGGFTHDMTLRNARCSCYMYCQYMTWRTKNEHPGGHTELHVPNVSTTSWWRSIRCKTFPGLPSRKL